MTEPIVVTTVIGRTELVAGRIHRTRAAGAFVYDEGYLRNRDALELVPALPLTTGAFPLAGNNPFSDSAPDTWGRKILNRAAGRTLDEISLLLGVVDESRQGATRFWLEGKPLADEHGVPAEADLGEVISIADRIDRGDRDIENVAVRRLFRATGSLGGARPKANVRLGSELWLAKFPKPQGDDWNVMAWEAAILDIAESIGIQTPKHMTKHVTVAGEKKTVLVVRRFDRAEDGIRIPYISAMTALEARDGDGGDWLDVVDFAQLHGADTTELWRRALLGAAVGNLDDHLRNHGFLRAGRDWKLSPIFDVNPTPLGDGNKHELGLFGASQATPSDFMTPEAIEMFGVKQKDVDEYLPRLRNALGKAPRFASNNGADQRSIDVMDTRFSDAVSALS